MKKIIKTILEPNILFKFLAFNVGMGLLIYVFLCGLENTVIAYVSYLLSTYALVIFCIWFYKTCQFGNRFIKEKSKIYQFHQQHFQVITKISFIISFTINLIYGILKLVSGIYYKSEWFITFAAYYLLLCFMKISLIFAVKKNDFGVNLKKENEKLKHTGKILLLLDLILAGIIVLIIYQNQTITYPQYVVYIIAIYDFYLIINAIINVFKYRKQKSPILRASKCINLTVAMISMISLEVTMISAFGSNETDLKIIMTFVLGFGVAIVNSLMAIYMMITANKKAN